MHIIGSGNSNRAFVTSFKRDSRGFTLIELMVVVMIVGVLAAIAIPSYRRYAVLNAERDTQAKMLQLQIQLERWRSSALSYKGFKPQQVNNSITSYGYDDTPTNKTIYVPSASDYRYKITLVDGTTVDGTTSANTLAPAASTTTVDSSTGRTWKMLAEPNTTGVTKNANKFMMLSTGMRCQSKDDAITIASTDCGNGQKSW